VERIVGIYEQAQVEHARAPRPSAAEEQAAASAYLEWLNPFVKEREQAIAWAEQLLEEAQRRGALIESLDLDLRSQSQRAHPWLYLRDTLDRLTVLGHQMLDHARLRPPTVPAPPPRPADR
jgi:hypothetical protein